MNRKVLSILLAFIIILVSLIATAVMGSLHAITVFAIGYCAGVTVIVALCVGFNLLHDTPQVKE